MPLIKDISKLNWIATIRSGSAVASVEAFLIRMGLMTYLQKEL